MCFSNDGLLSADDYARALQVVGILNSRNIIVISVSFNISCDFDILVAATDAVNELPNPLCISISSQGQMWQSHYWGVRVRWFERYAAKTVTQQEQPTPIKTPSLWARLGKLLGVNHAP